MNSAISCEVCGEKLLAKNLKRHVDRLHGSYHASDEKVCRSSSCTESAVDDGSDRGVIFEPMKFKVDSETVNEAVISGPRGNYNAGPAQKQPVRVQIGEVASLLPTCRQQVVIMEFG